MYMRNSVILLVAFGYVGIVNAQDRVDFASGAGSEAQLASFDRAVDSDCSSACANTCGSCGERSCGCSRFDVRGWLDVGFLLNGNESASSFHGPYNQTDRHEGGLNQAYLVFERSLADNSCPSMGGRLDIVYGTDAFLAESKGFERAADGSVKWNGDNYGLAIPQAYGEIGNDQLSLKVGHFYTIVGYEGVPASRQ